MNEWAIRDRWKEIDGRCECSDGGHGHEGRCYRKLTFVRRGYNCREGWDIKKEYGHGGVNRRIVTGFKIICMECLRNNYQKGDVSAGNDGKTNAFLRQSVVENGKDAET
ncbi:MAG: hypothetical protein A2W25_10475 [candidate division Zixibacteria bacterium RBG_16_53_22]|nr:MAG: hypothetical protein A2W25_10475 [candidate division Zixibacteria bacterium RBG_16_53_22]